jgi:hypothetical protein
MTARFRELRAADRTGWAQGPGPDGTIDPRQAAVTSEKNKFERLREARSQR